MADFIFLFDLLYSNKKIKSGINFLSTVESKILLLSFSLLDFSPKAKREQKGRDFQSPTKHSPVTRFSIFYTHKGCNNNLDKTVF
jgi:hypothetical protein